MHISIDFNPAPPIPEEEEKQLKFLFPHFFVVPQRFYEGFKKLHKNLSFYFNTTFWNARGERVNYIFEVY